MQLVASSVINIILPLHFYRRVTSKVISSFALRMKHFNNFVSVLVRAARVTLESSSGEDGEARHRSGCQSTPVHLGAETVENKVRKENKETFGGGGFGSRRSENHPAAVDRRSSCRHLGLVMKIITSCSNTSFIEKF